jgi:hypothetical protein
VTKENAQAVQAILTSSKQAFEEQKAELLSERKAQMEEDKARRKAFMDNMKRVGEQLRPSTGPEEKILHSTVDEIIKYSLGNEDIDKDSLKQVRAFVITMAGQYARANPNIATTNEAIQSAVAYMRENGVLYVKPGSIVSSPKVLLRTIKGDAKQPTFDDLNSKLRQAGDANESMLYGRDNERQNGGGTRVNRIRELVQGVIDSGNTGRE